MKIMLDAGHGYQTAGKRSPDGMREYEFNRAVVMYIKSYLQDYQNITVYLSHSDQRDVPLLKRTTIANRLSVDCFLSVHANAFGNSWNTVRGIETYIHRSKPKEAFELAERIQNLLVLATGMHNRGVKYADFHVLRATKMTAILIECGFMTNKQDILLLRSDAYRRTCAQAIVKALSIQYHLQK